MRERIASFDILRGYAVLGMIFIQIFDFFARANIYADFPYYLPFVNMPWHGIGFGLFIFVSGACVNISLSHRLKKGLPNTAIFLRALKRYGGYILLSLVFSTVVLELSVFLRWNEVIQGIGLAALAAILIIMVFRKNWTLPVIAVAVLIAHPILLNMFYSTGMGTVIPFGQETGNMIQGLGAVLQNMAVGGFFSLSFLLPMTLAGAFLSSQLLTRDRGKVIRFSLIGGIVLILISLVANLTVNQYQLYARTPSITVLLIGISFLLFGFVESMLKRFKQGRISNMLTVFGKAAIIAYLIHFTFIFKPLVMLGIESSFDFGISWLFAIILTVLIYYISRTWLVQKHRLYSWIGRILKKNG